MIKVVPLISKNQDRKKKGIEIKDFKIEIPMLCSHGWPFPLFIVMRKYLEQEVIVVPCSSQVEYNSGFPFLVIHLKNSHLWHLHQDCNL